MNLIRKVRSTEYVKLYIIPFFFSKSVPRSCRFSASQYGAQPLLFIYLCIGLFSDPGLNLSRKSNASVEDSPLDLGSKPDDDAPLNLSLKPAPRKFYYQKLV